MGRPLLTAEELKRRGIGPGSPNWTRYKDRIAKESKGVAVPVVTPKEPLRKAPPKHMVDPQQRALWSKILATAPPGALGASDEIAVELAVYLYQKLLKNELKPSEAAQLKVVLMSFGMFPHYQKAEHPAQPNSNEPPKGFDLLSAIKADHATKEAKFAAR